ncbi:MAG TPA: HTTM domain-containing protein [Acidimicrobiales bacterium]|nr:HTTM domain-containing protein [Acidimicrobiales bacterium]
MTAATTATTAGAAGAAGGWGSALDRVDELLGRRVSLRSLALLRILVGPVVLLHLWPFVGDALDGRIYRDQFHEPYAAWYPELPRALYSGLLYVGVAAAVALSLGILTRVTSVVTFGVVAYNLFLSTTNVHNNRAFLVIVLAGLAVAPCGRELSVDAWWRRRTGRPPLDPRAPGWPLWLLRFEAGVLYGASGLSKLLDPDWFGGTVTWHRVTQHRADMLASPLPGWAIDLLLDRSFHTVAAKLIVLTELSIAAGLWSRRTRYAAVWLAVCFHVAIQLTASVEVFSYLAIAALVIWAVPSTGDRVLALDRSVPSHRRLARTVGALDWLARFRVVDRPGPGTDAGPGPDVGSAEPVVTDRDGTTMTGRPALALVLSRLPLTAWPTLPLLLLPSVRRARRPAAPIASPRPAAPTDGADSAVPADASDAADVTDGAASMVPVGREVRRGENEAEGGREAEGGSDGGRAHGEHQGTGQGQGQGTGQGQGGGGMGGRGDERGRGAG